LSVNATHACKIKCNAVFRPWEFRLPEYMVHDEHKPFGDDYDYKNDPEGLIYWKKGRVVPGKYT